MGLEARCPTAGERQMPHMQGSENSFILVGGRNRGEGKREGREGKKGKREWEVRGDKDAHLLGMERESRGRGSFLFKRGLYIRMLGWTPRGRTVY